MSVFGTLAEQKTRVVFFDEFINQKGPDFLSRLRGYLDIEGVNTHGPDRYLRRALVLHYQLGKRSPGLIHERSDTRNVDKSLLASLLHNVHYVHGARSMEALLDMCMLTGKEQFTWNDLPDEHLMKLHVNRDENRELFSCGSKKKDRHRCIELIVQGLLRLDWQ